MPSGPCEPAFRRRRLSYTVNTRALCGVMDAVDRYLEYIFLLCFCRNSASVNCYEDPLECIDFASIKAMILTLKHGVIDAIL